MTSQAEIGLIGLGVMGQNLALNIAERGFPIAVYNRTPARTEAFAASDEAARLPVTACLSLESLVAALARPRAVMLMVKAGAATDGQIEALAPLLDPGDVIIDGGNARYQDTIRRERALARAGASCFSAPGSRAARRARVTALDHGRRRTGRRTSGCSRSSRRSPPRSTARPARPTSARTGRVTSSR